MSIVKLPDPEGQTDRERGYEMRLYTAAQMRAAILEERERCAKICDQQEKDYWRSYESWTPADCSAAIRSQ